MKKNSDRNPIELENSRIRADRIEKIRQFYCNGNNADFAIKLGFSKQYASGLCTAGERITERTLEKILKIFPDVSRQWLYFGDGDMLICKNNQQSGMTVGGDNIVNGSTKTTSEGLDTLIATNAKLAATLQQQADQIDRLLNIIESKL